MTRKSCMWLAALLLAGTPVSARTETRTTRSGDRITLANDHVEAVFRTSEAFDIETLRLNGRELLEAGRNRTPWILYYKGTQGESPELKPEHALYEGVEVSDGANGKTLRFTWQLTLDYSGKTYPVRMDVSLPDQSELLR